MLNFQILPYFLFFPIILSENCHNDQTKCSGFGSVWNKTDSRCVCGLGDNHMWGDSCQYGRLRLTEKTGHIIDSENSYHCQSKYIFLIDSGSNFPIRLTFNEFVTECNWDYLYVFDGPSYFSPVISSFSGNIKGANSSEVTRSVTAISGAAYLYFYSDPGSIYSGFNISYQISSCQHQDCNNHGICDYDGKCLCDNGWSGANCTKQDCCYSIYRLNGKSAECLMCNQNNKKVLPRASHAATTFKHTFMMVFGGMSHAKGQRMKNSLNKIQRYNLQEKKWEILSSYSKNPSLSVRYGHSIVADGDSLIVFGGTIYSNENNPEITNELYVFTKTNTWKNIETIGCIPVSGHAAVVVQGTMYVFFGYNKDHVFLNKVQKLKLKVGGSDWDDWEIVKHRGHIFRGRYGHTATYDQMTNSVYVFAGFIEYVDVTDELLIFDVGTERWSVGASSHKPRMLHSAGIINRNLVVFGGDAHSRHTINQCYTNDILVYSIDCNKWTLVDAGINEKQRYGHSAVVFNSSLYVFGGYDGTFLNDVIEIRLGGDCNLPEDFCLKAHTLSGCVWEKSAKKCSQYDPNLPERSIVRPQCSNELNCSVYHNCTSCTSYQNCKWVEHGVEGKCVQEKESVTGISHTEQCASYIRDQCLIVNNCYTCEQHPKCEWVPSKDVCRVRTDGENSTDGKNCFNNPSITSCHDMSGCGECVNNTNCLWCETTKECLHYSAYVVNFPYGQCLEWISNSNGKCRDVLCEHQMTCHTCLQLPNCGWCDDGSGTGVGQCMAGTDITPISSNHSCDASRWKFTECPSCHCNGHSTCINGTNECQQCHGNVVGTHCENCKFGYYGNPENNGTCPYKCECNNHLRSCDRDGKCTCNLQGVTGEHCEKCDASRSYRGDPRNGGICYYPLKVNFQYSSNLRQYTVAGYSLITEKNREAVDFELLKTTGPDGYLNLTIRYANNRTTAITSSRMFGSYKVSIQEDMYDYDGRAEIQVVVYGWDGDKNIALKLTFSHPDSKFDLAYFLIMFIVCFVSLLIILLIVWRIKQRYDRYMHERRQKQEQEVRISRPFHTMNVLLRDKYNYKDKKIRPGLLSMQYFRRGNCGPASFIVELPRDENNYTPSGQCGVCIGTLLVQPPQKQTLTKLHAYYKKRPKAIPV